MIRREWGPVALMTAVALLFGACEGSDPGSPASPADPVAERAVLAEKHGSGKATYRFATSSQPRAIVERKNTQVKDAADAAAQAVLTQLLRFLPELRRNREVNATTSRGAE